MMDEPVLGKNSKPACFFHFSKRKDQQSTYHRVNDRTWRCKEFAWSADSLSFPLIRKELGGASTITPAREPHNDQAPGGQQQFQAAVQI